MKIKGKWMKYMIFGGLMECEDHSYAWSGKMPCTGVYGCIFCGKTK